MLLLCLFAFFVSVHCAPQHFSKFHDATTRHIRDTLQRTLPEGFDFERADFVQVDSYDQQFNKQYNNHASVTYEIYPDFSESAIETILESLAHYEEQTCLTFTPVKKVQLTDFNELSRIVFLPIQPTERTSIPVPDCNVAYEKLANFDIHLILLDEESCLNETGRINQLIYRSLGLPNENLRPIRDDHVTVLWENVEPGFQNQFLKENYEDDLFKDLDYDYLSVSHYYPDEFSKNGNPTLVSKDPKQPLKKNTELSSSDVLKINNKYCLENKPVNISPNPFFYLSG